MASLMQLTDRQIVRLYCRLYDRLKDGMEGDPFGMDRPTMLIVKPACMRAMDSVRTEAIRRRDAGIWTLPID